MNPSGHRPKVSAILLVLISILVVVSSHWCSTWHATVSVCQACTEYTGSLKLQDGIFRFTYYNESQNIWSTTDWGFHGEIPEKDYKNILYLKFNLSPVDSCPHFQLLGPNVGWCGIVGYCLPTMQVWQFATNELQFLATTQGESVVSLTVFSATTFQWVETILFDPSVGCQQSVLYFPGSKDEYTDFDPFNCSTTPSVSPSVIPYSPEPTFSPTLSPVVTPVEEPIEAPPIEAPIEQPTGHPAEPVESPSPFLDPTAPIHQSPIIEPPSIVPTQPQHLPVPHSGPPISEPSDSLTPQSTAIPVLVPANGNLRAGAIVAIVLGSLGIAALAVLLAFAAYKVTRRRRHRVALVGEPAIVRTNPLYVSSAHGGVNPLYKMRT